MIVVRQTSTFARWFEQITDARARARVAVRIRRLTLGNPGDVASVGSSVSEMRIDYGPGYRVYFTMTGPDSAVRLCGGDKRTQARDIARAMTLASHL